MQIAPHTTPGLGTHWLPLTGTQLVPSISYLHERDHKRELASAERQRGHADRQARSTRIWNAICSSICARVRPDAGGQGGSRSGDRPIWTYYDKIIEISRNRFNAGDIAQIDLDRIELLRVQYESEIQTAIVNLRTSKIQLLQLLDDRTPVEQFDVTGRFDFSDDLKPLEDFRQIALDERPDLRAALEPVQQAQTNHKLAIANGSTDPTFSTWYT